MSTSLHDGKTNIAQVASNWPLGRHITEHELGNGTRADYGKYIVKLVANELTRE